MKDESGRTNTPEETKALEALRALRPPRADASFRERLKAEFSSGAIAEREPAAGAAGARVTPLPRAGRRRLLASPWAWIPATAAVAASLAFAVGIVNRAADWDAVRVSGATEVLVDGKRVPLRADDEFCKHLTPGSRLEVPEGAEISLICGNQIAMYLTGGTTVSMPAPPGRWFDRSLEMRVHQGEIHITTGPAFRGARLAVVTPEARAEVTGTTLAVICREIGTCVCVYDGAVNVGPHGGDMAMVHGGLRGIVYRDKRPSEIVAIRDDERAQLSRYREEMRPKLE
jgi:ferric-dicitrate binding protein FerR (iron transport regulator)